MVRLQVKPGAIYPIPWDNPDAKPAEYFLEHGDTYFSLVPIEGSEPILPDFPLLRRVVENGLRERLKANGFSFRGAKEYTAYLPEKIYNKQNARFFSLHPGFDFRVVSYPTGAIDDEELLLAVDYHVVLVVRASVAELVNAGLRAAAFDGLSARIAVPGARESGVDCRILAMREESHAVLCDVLDYRTNETKTVDAAAVYIEPKPEIIQEKILSVVDPHFDLINFIRAKGFLNSNVASRERFQKAQDIVEGFLVKKRIFPFSVGDTTVDIDPKFLPVTGSSYPSDGNLEEPLLLFDRDDSSAVAGLATVGLSKFGPYTKSHPQISVALLGTRAGNTLVRALVNQLNQGTDKMPGGMARFFKTQLRITTEEECSGEEPDDYLNAVNALIRNITKPTTPDVVLVHLPKRTADTSAESPYFASKPVLLEAGLVSQMLTPYTLNDPQWKYANVASAIYAKAGGIPWVLAKDLDGFDMILGIAVGEKIAATRRAGSHPRFVSYANVFDRFGRWLFFESGTARYEFGNHAEQVSTLIAQAVDRFKDVNRAFPDKIAIHYYKRFGQNERTLISDALKERNPNIKIAFVTIDDSHPLRLYDTRTIDGSYPRGSYAKLNDTELLLSTTGFTPLSKKRMGTPVFPKLTVWQWPEDFVTIEQIAQHVLSLTRLNYKALTPIVGEPVTMKYAGLAAKFMASFSETQWKNCIQNSTLKRVPWFL